jgi:hypothetical protein
MNEDLCLECYTGYELSEGLCNGCDENCLTCNDLTKTCTACKESYYLDNHNKCVLTCGHSYYTSDSTG